jgi:hypothetical protein
MKGTTTVQSALDERLLTEIEIDDKVLRMLRILVKFGPSGASCCSQFTRASADCSACR